MDGRWKNKNAKTEGVNVGWQLPHVRICSSPSEHFSLHAMARAGGAQWERERERRREAEWQPERLVWWQASLPSCFYITLFFFPPLWLFLSFASSYPIMHPLDISGQRSVPGSDRGSGPSVTQSPMSSLVFLVFFSFVYTMTQVKVVLQFTLDENWIVNSTYSVLFNFYCWCITL